VSLIRWKYPYCPLKPVQFSKKQDPRENPALKAQTSISDAVEEIIDGIKKNRGEN